LKTALFPGSFDPITNGHIEIIKKAKSIFDNLILAIGINNDKEYWISLEDRILILKKIFINDINIKVIFYDDLTVNIAKKMNARWILRGIRNQKDFCYEMSLSNNCKQIFKEIDIIWIPSDIEFSNVSSSFIKKLNKCNHNIKKYIPDKAYEILKKKGYC
jgi:pantetheine-phosphate adenylyltransferase